MIDWLARLFRHAPRPIRDRVEQGHPLTGSPTVDDAPAPADEPVAPSTAPEPVEHRFTISANAASAMYEGRHADSVQLQTGLVDRMAAEFGPKSFELLYELADLIWYQLNAGMLDAARASIERAEAIMGEITLPNELLRGKITGARGRLYALEGLPAEALPGLTAGFDATLQPIDERIVVGELLVDCLAKVRGPSHHDTEEAAAALARLVEHKRQKSAPHWTEQDDYWT